MERHRVRVTRHRGNLIESYHCAPGPPEGVSRHTHETYQLCLAEGVACRYVYRGSSHLVPKGRFCVLHPGEPHETEGAEDRPPGAVYQMLYLELDAVRGAAEALGTPSDTLPFFRTPVIEDKGIVTLLRRFFKTLGSTDRETGEDDLFHTFLTALVLRHADLAITPHLPRARPEVERIIAFLHDHSGRRVTLDELAQLTGLSVYHVVRLFRREIGLTPYAFHLQLRVTEAKTLIGQGESIASAALSPGFYDQSQLTKHFRQFVGTTPSHYKETRFA